MDQERSDIREDIEHKRRDIADKLDELGTRIDTARQTVRESVSPKHHVQQRPWMTVGAAVAAGYVTQRILERRHDRRHFYESYRVGAHGVEGLRDELHRFEQRMEDRSLYLESLFDEYFERSQRRPRRTSDGNVEINPLTGIAAAVLSGVTRAIAMRAISGITDFAQQHLHDRSERRRAEEQPLEERGIEWGGRTEHRTPLHDEERVILTPDERDYGPF